VSEYVLMCAAQGELALQFCAVEGILLLLGIMVA